MVWKVYLDGFLFFFFFFNVKGSFPGGLGDKAFQRLWNERERVPGKRSSDLRIGLPGVVFNQTIQHLVFISTNKSMPSRALTKNVLILRIRLVLLT